MKKALNIAISAILGLVSLNTAYASSPVNQTAVKNSHDTIEIIMANFGNSEKRCNTKALVSKACDKKVSCDLPAMMEICDPAKSVEPRVLTVLYSCGDRTHLLSEAEGRSIRVMCPR